MISRCKGKSLAASLCPRLGVALRSCGGQSSGRLCNYVSTFPVGRGDRVTETLTPGQGLRAGPVVGSLVGPCLEVREKEVWEGRM